MIFKDYYEEYLGMGNGEDFEGVLVCRSNYRDIPINKHYCYKMIATVFEGRKVMSCSAEYSKPDIRDMLKVVDFSMLQDFTIEDTLQGGDDSWFYLYRMQLKHKKEYFDKENRKLPDGRDIEFIHLEK